MTKATTTMAVSIREVAAEANVSLGTVSKVLNNSANANISPATRERVRVAARRIGYHPNAVARGLVGKRMDTIGLVLAYDQASVTSDPYLGPCLDGIFHVSKRNRQKTVIFTEDDWQTALTHLPAYTDGHCDGLLIIIPRLDSEIVAALPARKVPFVLVGDSREDDNLICVDVDNAGSARRMMAHLTGLGHKCIAAFCGNADFRSNSQRFQGYRDGLAAANLPFDDRFVWGGEYRPEFGYKNMNALLDRFPEGERPTAVFCLNDQVAFGALNALRERGLSAPHSISVAGFDDIGEAEALGLTTMRHPIRAVAERATEALLAHINGEVASGSKIALPADLITRTTTATPRR